MRMFSPLSTDFFEDFDRIVNSLARPTYANTIGFQPSLNVDETEQHYLVSFDMPGVRKENIRIEAKGNQLLISGERQREGRTDKFERTFALPTSVNIDKIEAHYENGVLNVALPKAEAERGRQIQIQSGEGGFFSKLLSSKKETDVAN